MPLIDGIEVFSDERSSRSIQTNINAIPELSQDLKTDIDPKKINLTDENTFDSSDMNIFFDENGYGGDGTANSRKDRYSVYREMDGMEFIHRGIEIIADDSSQENEDGDVLKVFSDDEKIKGTILDLFTNKLNINNELWSIFYETVKMGDNFYEVIPDDYKKPKEIKRIRYLEPDKMERIEKDGKLSHFTYKVEKKEGNKIKETLEYKLFPWQIIHFKVDNKAFLPYGGSLLEAGVRTYRRLVMLEDLMLVYRISRAPERRVFYIDVGNMNAVESRRFLTKMKNAYRSQSFIDENGNINKKANVMSITSDIFVPVKEGSSNTRIETLQGGQSMGASGSEDPLLSYFKSKILKTMNIPPSYMGEQADLTRNLSTIDQKFGRFIERMQAQINQGLNKIAAIELFFTGYKKEDLNNFKIELTPPSNVKEITEIELINQRMTLVQSIQATNIFNNEWILKNIFKMSDKEVADLTLQKSLQGNEAQAGGMAGGMDGGMDMAGGVPDMGAGAPEAPVAAPPTEGETPAAEPQELTAGTIVDMFGKDFLLENKEDFFTVVKAVKKFNKPPTPIPLMEAISDFVIEDFRDKKHIIKNNVTALLTINEFKGLDLTRREVSFWDKDETGTVKSLEEIVVSCGVKAINE